MRAAGAGQVKFVRLWYWRSILLHRIVRLSLILAGAVSFALGQAKPIPQLVKTGGKYTFLVVAFPPDHGPHAAVRGAPAASSK